MDVDALIKLQELKEKGIISEKEFNAEKYKIINKDNMIRKSYTPVSGCLIAIIIFVSLLFVFIVFVSSMWSLLSTLHV